MFYVLCSEFSALSTLSWVLRAAPTSSTLSVLHWTRIAHSSRSSISTGASAAGISEERITRSHLSSRWLLSSVAKSRRLNQGWRLSHLWQRFRAIIKTSEAVLWPTTPHIILQHTHNTAKRNFHPLGVSPWYSVKSSTMSENKLPPIEISSHRIVLWFLTPEFLVQSATPSARYRNGSLYKTICTYHQRSYCLKIELKKLSSKNSPQILVSSGPTLWKVSPWQTALSLVWRINILLWLVIG